MPRIRLRPHDESHVPLLFEAARESVAEVFPWLPWCHPNYEISEAQDWIHDQIRKFEARSEFHFAIESSDGAYLGGCGLGEIHALHRFANLGYWVRTSRAGRGVAPRAVGLLAEWAFSHTDLVRLEIVAAVRNERSQRVAEKAGASREGVLFERIQLHGASHDAVVFSMTRDRPARASAVRPRS